MDGILRRCLSEIETPSILAACHDSACGGHFSGLLTAQKVLGVGYFWPTCLRMLKNMSGSVMLSRGMQGMISA